MKKDFKWTNDRERLLLGKARRVVYETLADGSELALHFFLPKNYQEGDPRPVLLFFHGGGWERVGLVQFAPHALYYVERGAVAALVEYRVRATHPQSRPSESWNDAWAAVRFVRESAVELNVDTGRVVVIGADAGANLAGAVLLQASPGQAGDSRPNAGVLLSAIFDVVKGGPGFSCCGSAAEAKQVSLSRCIEGGAPPLLVIHGNADRLVPFEEAEEFAAKVERKKNLCRLVEFEGRDREFFNFNLDPVSFEAVLAEIDGFLDENGLLPRRPGEAGPQLISWREGDI